MSSASLEQRPERGSTFSGALDAYLHKDIHEVFVWGRNDQGQLGCGEQETIVEPCSLPDLRGKSISQTASSVFHTCFVTDDGELYMCGANECGQLALKGPDKVLTPHRVDALDTYPIMSASTGTNFTVAITKSQRRVVSWGGGEFGQLGTGAAVAVQALPKFIKGLGYRRIARVATGGAHALLLSDGGQLYSCGMGMHGALGHGNELNSDAPQLVEQLWPVGVTAIAAGENHSGALSVDGRVYMWGRGKYGALGLGSLESSSAPRQVQALSQYVVTQLAAGGDHTVALCSGGQIYSWGQGTWGQTGLACTDNVCQPLRMTGIEGREIVQISAGMRHTLLLAADGAIFVCGNSEYGQTGCGFSGNVLTCREMPRPAAWTNHECIRVDAAGDHSFAVLLPSSSGIQRESNAGLNAARETCCRDLTALQMPDLIGLARQVGSGEQHSERLAALLEGIDAVFESPGFLISGFLVPGGTRGGGGDEGLATHRLDLNAIAATYSALLLVYENGVVLAVQHAVSRMLDRLVSLMRAASPENTSLHQAQWLKVLLILLQNPMNGDAAGQVGQHLVAQLARVIILLKHKPLQVLTRWLASLPADVLGGRIIQPLQRHLTTYVEAHPWSESTRQHVLLVGTILQVLDAANKQAHSPVHYTKLHNAAVSRAVLPYLQTEYIKWITSKQGPQVLPPVSICQLPFLMDPECKKAVMQGEASLQQNHEVRHSQMEAIELMAQGYFLGHHLASIGFLDITVRRSAVVEDAMNQLQARAADLKKPLRVTFLGQDNVREEGLDEGGVSKEFFQLLVRALFSGDYGMFEYNDETRECYFSPAAMETGAQGVDFRLVGTVLGLAIFNGIILDVHFPQVVYKKLLGGKTDFDDLLDAKPSLAKGLKKLQEYSGDDLEDVFCLTFEVEYSLFDTVNKVELIPNGSNISVTQQNKQLYIDKVVEWHLDKSVKEAFQHFRDGFYSVCSGYALTLFSYQELELLICGLPHLDFHALEKAARYDGGFSAEHPVIRRFWQVVHSMSIEEKKRFLFFVTGCDRAPMGGLGKLTMVIQRGGPHAERLPTAHTCFNTLLLPEYNNIESLRSRLFMAISNAEGFGLQ